MKNEKTICTLPLYDAFCLCYEWLWPNSTSHFRSCNIHTNTPSAYANTGTAYSGALRYPYAHDTTTHDPHQQRLRA